MILNCHEELVNLPEFEFKDFPLKDYITFFKEFRSRFTTTGAITPSSRFLASAMAGPLKKLQQSGEKNEGLNILEVGPGTGAVTKTVVKLLKPADRFDLVELNENFVALLNDRFERDPSYHKVEAQSKIHVCPLQEFQTDVKYDIIISGLPLNNFPPDLVKEIFEKFFDLLSPGGVLSYFEYMYIRSIKKKISGKATRDHLVQLEEVIGPYLDESRINQSWVFMNTPPAWVQHLQKT